MTAARPPKTCPDCGGNRQPDVPRCAACYKARKAARRATSETPPTPPDPEPAPTPRLFCREHHQPVTWRGTGCEACREHLEARRSAKRRKPKPRREESQSWSFM